MQAPHLFWARDAALVAADLASGPAGLTTDEAAARLATHGPNQLRARPGLSRLRATIAQLRHPLLVILIFAAMASLATGQWIDAGIVLTAVPRNPTPARGPSSRSARPTK